jgi:hypothetical protein
VLSSNEMRRRRTTRIALRLAGRWLRPSGAVAIEIGDISAHGLFLTNTLEMPIGQLQKIEVELPDKRCVTLLVVPRHAARSEWATGLGLEIHTASQRDRDEWRACFEAMDRVRRQRVSARAPG